MSYFTQVGYSDTGSLDAFSRLRTSSPEQLFSVQSQYGIDSLQMEVGATGNGIVPNNTQATGSTRMVALTCSGGISGVTYIQSYQYHPYQPGKALKNGEPVLTIYGWKNIEDIIVGDIVFDGLGNQTDVIGVFPQGERKIYRITFDDGTIVDCDGEHLWKTVGRWDNKRGEERIITTNQMLEEQGEVPSQMNRWRIPASPVLDVPESITTIDSYTLGVILGDGDINDIGMVGFTTVDTEILSYLKCEVSKHTSKYHYGLLGLSELIRGLKLNNTNFLTKFIPSEYLYNSKEVRLSMLQGLMDTDGYVDKNGGTCEFNSASKDLAEGVAYLTRSLGGQAKIKVREAGYKNEDGEYVRCSDSYRVTVIIPVCPFRLERKAFYWKPRTRISFDRYIHSIKELGNYQATCIRVSSEDHTFLTRNNIVTHNSQFIAMTGVIGNGVPNTFTDMMYGDANNGVIFRQSGDTLQFILRTSTSGSISDDNKVDQSSWNIDTFNGAGRSGINLSIDKALILIIDLQFLGMGRVRVGFDVDGVVYYAHEFKNANNLSVPYMQTASLPVGMMVTSYTSSTKTAFFKCCAVQSEGGFESGLHQNISTPDVSVTAGNNLRTHVVSIRPKTTYNGITNRTKIEIQDLNIILPSGGNSNNIYWELIIGASFSSSPNWTDCDSIYSSTQYGTGGTYTQSTGFVIERGYMYLGTAQRIPLVIPYPISLDRAGNVRNLGTLSLFYTGIGGSTNGARAIMNFNEIK